MPRSSGCRGRASSAPRACAAKTVASLSGVSACWYAWLEQGRDMRVSDDVLERLCGTLKLSEDERVYLFSLVQHRAPRVRTDEEGEAPAEVVRLIESLPMPAIAMNLCWDVLAWNPVQCEDLSGLRRDTRGRSATFSTSCSRGRSGT
ncbi:MAG: helix-turn-helix domain-containing protein [Gammaproteobacteria bacterium]